MEPQQIPDAEERAAIAEAGPADVNSEPSGAEDQIARFVRYAASWAFTKQKTGTPISSHACCVNSGPLTDMC